MGEKEEEEGSFVKGAWFMEGRGGREKTQRRGTCARSIDHSAEITSMLRTEGDRGVSP